MPGTAGSVTRAGAGMRAPSQGSVIGDLSTAATGFLSGMQDERKRQEEMALREAMMALQERQVAVQEEGVRLQGQQLVQQAEQFDVSVEIDREKVGLSREDLGLRREEFEFRSNAAEEAIALEEQYRTHSTSSYQQILMSEFGKDPRMVEQLDYEGARDLFRELSISGRQRMESQALVTGEAMRAAQMLMESSYREMSTIEQQLAGAQSEVQGLMNHETFGLPDEVAIDLERPDLAGMPMRVLPADVRQEAATRMLGGITRMNPETGQEEYVFQPLNPGAASLLQAAPARIEELRNQIEGSRTQLQQWFSNPESMLGAGAAPLFGTGAGAGSSAMTPGSTVQVPGGGQVENPAITWDMLPPEGVQETTAAIVRGLRENDINLFWSKEAMMAQGVPLQQIIEESLGLAYPEWVAQQEELLESRGVPVEAPRGLTSGGGGAAPNPAADIANERMQVAAQIVETEEQEKRMLQDILEGWDSQDLALQEFDGETFQSESHRQQALAARARNAGVSLLPTMLQSAKRLMELGSTRADVLDMVKDPVYRSFLEAQIPNRLYQPQITSATGYHQPPGPAPRPPTVRDRIRAKSARTGDMIRNPPHRRDG